VRDLGPSEVALGALHRVREKDAEDALLLLQRAGST
jgi:hypothetical protein